MEQKPSWDDAPDKATHLLKNEKENEYEFSFYDNSHFKNKHREIDRDYIWFDLGYWTVVEERPKAIDTFLEDFYTNSVLSVGEHYNNYVTIELEPDSLISGELMLKVDPHFVSHALNMKGGCMEHIFKKAMRSSSKGHSQIEVYREIIALAERGIELEELLK